METPSRTVIFCWNCDLFLKYSDQVNSRTREFHNICYMCEIELHAIKKIEKENKEEISKIKSLIDTKKFQYISCKYLKNCETFSWGLDTRCSFLGHEFSTRQSHWSHIRHRRSLVRGRSLEN